MGIPFAPSPPGRVTRWLRRNLFRTPLDGVVTVVGGALALYVVYRLVRFVLVTGRWDVVRDNLKLFMVGRYPTVHLPRVSVSVIVAALAAGLVAGVVHRRQVAAGTSTVVRLSPAARLLDLLERFWPVLLGAVLVLALTTTPGPTLTVVGALVAAIAGRVVGARLPKRTHWIVIVAALATPFVLVAYLADGLGWHGWGGMMLNIFLAVVSIILCFPLGVLMALGRRSRLPLIRGMCTALIEVVRGAPLFVLLLMANVALGFFVPREWAPSDVVRAIVVFTVFTAAYVAEIVRGGLQSLPRGQEEAGRALGLSPTRVTFLIVLPQALRNVIPAQVGQFISLFKDTVLVGAAMGLFEVLRVAQAVTTQGEFQGQNLLPETFGFVGLLFWVGSYTMSRESQRIEHKLGVGER
jgi:general L-amino acid transport system permease protein